ncbi:FMN-dependent NADH-azoreductase [Flavobacterium sp. 3HN19-14]|uniref:FMN-dependent NADH-azoreductase n=1 Tax=Flavobacterium sp. 3HN19-14 TaxID=3448133 RepID=UPI003EE14957
MKKILHIITSPRGEQSASTQLSNAVVAKLLAENPDSEVISKDFSSTSLPHMEGTLVTSYFTPAATHSPEHKAAIANSDVAIAELKEADFIVIGIPMYNFGVPSTLKSWIDHIMRAGHTFSYGENGSVGLVENKKVYLAIASGNVYSHGKYTDYDFIAPYLRAVLGFIGITDITVFRAEGTSIPALAENSVEKGIAEIVL